MNNINAALLVALAISGISCNDLQVGTDNGRIVFNETIQASPTIWRQVQKITVNVTDHEEISYVKVTDNRAEKDGEAQIVEGGEGQKNVTLELKSPTVFRGFDFHVVVFAAQAKDKQNPSHPVMNKDVDVNSSAKPYNEDAIDSVTEDTETHQKDAPVASINSQEHIPVAPVVTGEQPRINRNAQEHSSDPIVQYVTEKNGDDQKVNFPEQKILEQTVTFLYPDETASEKTNGPVQPISVASEAKVEDGTSLKASEGSTLKINEDNFSITEAADMMSTEKTHEQMVMQNFDSISQELGQKVIFGIKKH